MNTGTQRITDLQHDLRNTPNPGSSKLVSLERPELVEEQETRPMGHNLAQQVVETLQTFYTWTREKMKRTFPAPAQKGGGNQKTKKAPQWEQDVTHGRRASHSSTRIAIHKLRLSGMCFSPSLSLLNSFLGVLASLGPPTKPARNINTTLPTAILYALARSRCPRVTLHTALQSANVGADSRLHQ